jgi:Kef-type K+ transport system membrane component KefB
MIVRRFRTVVLASLSVAIVVFCVYSIPTYFQLLAHQPDRNPMDATSFPPESAFFMGGIFAAISFALVFLVLLTVCAISRHRDSVKNIQGQSTRII